VQPGLPVSIFRRRLHRIDLRNHRKITVIDAHIAYCGSQNLTDERVRTRRIPPRYRFWIDATCRIQGPAATALQAAFLADWLTSTDEESIPDIKDYLTIPKPHGTSIVHVVPSGPTSRVDAIHQSLVTMLSVAQREIMMTTPYFVPDAAIKGLRSTTKLLAKNTSLSPEGRELRETALGHVRLINGRLRASAPIKHFRAQTFASDATLDTALAALDRLQIKLLTALK
jgi:cardiolipin synthase